MNYYPFLVPNFKNILKKSCLQSTVWPQPIWKKLELGDKYHHTYLGGPESASIEIPPFRPFLWSKFPKIKISKNFRIAPKFFFALEYIKNWTKVVPFVPEKKLLV